MLIWKQFFGPKNSPNIHDFSLPIPLFESFFLLSPHVVPAWFNPVGQQKKMRTVFDKNACIFIFLPSPPLFTPLAFNTFAAPSMTFVGPWWASEAARIMRPTSWKWPAHNAKAVHRRRLKCIRLLLEVDLVQKWRNGKESRVLYVVEKERVAATKWSNKVLKIQEFLRLKIEFAEPIFIYHWKARTPFYSSVKINLKFQICFTSKSNNYSNLFTYNTDVYLPCVPSFPTHTTFKKCQVRWTNCVRLTNSKIVHCALWAVFLLCAFLSLVQHKGRWIVWGWFDLVFWSGIGSKSWRLERKCF